MGLFSLAEVNRPKATGTLDGEPHSKVILPGTGGKLTDQQTKDANAGSLQRLVEFIPLESITLFWLAVPAANALAPAEQKREWYWGVYVGVMILTPLFLLLVYWSRKAILKDAAGKKADFPNWREWPWWRASASTIAFAIWAMAVPGNPLFGDKDTATMAFWAASFFVSTVLSLLDPIVLYRIFPAQNPNP